MHGLLGSRKNTVRVGVLRLSELAKEVESERVKRIAGQLEKRLVEMVNQCTGEEMAS